MVQAIGSSAGLSAAANFGAASGATPAALDRYRGDWSAPAPLSAPLPARAAAPAAAVRTGPNDAAATHRNALLADDVYRADPAPPAGTRVATGAELERLGLSPEMLEQPGVSSFRARVYVTGPAGAERYTVAFRGSQDGDDWKTNFLQGTGQESPHYRMALAIGRQIARTGADVEMTGHSLGGGLAAAAASASGRHADTFNAAGLHDRTLAQAAGIAAGAGRAPGSVDNYRVPGEILTFVQEGGDRLAGGILAGPLGALLADAPPAHGRQHDLDLVVPDDKNFLERHSRLDRHGMEWVIAATAERAGR